jgi:hypothetical protein
MLCETRQNYIGGFIMPKLPGTARGVYSSRNFIFIVLIYNAFLNRQFYFKEKDMVKKRIVRSLTAIVAVMLAIALFGCTGKGAAAKILPMLRRWKTGLPNKKEGQALTTP